MNWLAINGAFACLMALLVLSALIGMAWQRYQKHREQRELNEAVDELMRIGFLEADSRQWLEPYKTRLARFNGASNE
jgi:hypothetical protein